MIKCFILKRCFIQHASTKTILAALAAAVTLLAPAPAQADTSEWRGGNWSSWVGLVNNDIQYPDGITNGITPQQAAAVADNIAYDYYNVGMSFVRYPINPATVSSTNQWPVTQAVINELTADGLTVDLGCWYISSTNGFIPDMNTWSNMWKTVDGVYKNTNSVYYEPINEPGGYTDANLRNNVYAVFLGYGLGKSSSHYILDTSPSCTCSNIYNDARFNNCYACVHFYANSGRTTVVACENYVKGIVGNYTNRTIMNEFGADTTTGLNYLTSSNDYNTAFVKAMSILFRAWGMGSAWFPANQTPDLGGVRDNKVMFNGPGAGIVNRSLVDEVQNGWGFHTPVSATVCGFNTNTIGTTDYSLYRPSSFSWEIYSGGGGAWGNSADIAVPADYLGTGVAQMATWRTTNGNWFVVGMSQTHWGTNGDIPVPADYNGTGSAQFAVWRPSNGNWYVNGGAQTQYGTNGDIPVPGYYKGDGHADLAVYRLSNGKGYWYINGASTVQFGTNGDIPVPGDYYGSGTTQIAVWRPSTGTWWIYGGTNIQFGTTGDVPVPGDYTGSGKTQIAVWRPSSNTWLVYGVGNTVWGTTGDIPLPLPYAIRSYFFGYTH